MQGVSTVDRVIIEWFNSDFGTNFSNGIFGNTVLIILCLILTVVFASLIGLEREKHGHNAGLRTHLLVALGSAIVMVISVYGFASWDANSTSGRDPARLAAQVVAGIGFIGAGSIIRNGVSVKGLTTATTLWIAMAIGLCFGSGNIVIGISGSIIAYVTLVALKKVENKIGAKNPHLVIVIPADSTALKDIHKIADRYGVTLYETNTELISYQDTSALRLDIHLGITGSANAIAFSDEVRLNIRPLEMKLTSVN